MIGTTHVVTVTVPIPWEVDVKTGSEHLYQESRAGYPGYGSIRTQKTIELSAKGGGDPATLVQQLIKLAHDILDEIEGQS